jgi:hypothetical protein
MLGLKSPEHSAAGTVADTKGGGSSLSGGSTGDSCGGSSRQHRLRQKLKAQLPGHHQGSTAGGGGINGSNDGSGSGGSSSSDAVEQRRYIYSLGVRRLSLSSPLLPGSCSSQEAVLNTQVYLPVLPEGDEAEG